MVQNYPSDLRSNNSVTSSSNYTFTTTGTSTITNGNYVTTTTPLRYDYKTDYDWNTIIYGHNMKNNTNLKNNVIEIFRRMSLNKQVLFVTHKPELVVNLDVDNVIILKENEKTGKIEITSGALEYENGNINILKDIADILDGGEETIRKRWKRYTNWYEYY